MLHGYRDPPWPSLADAGSRPAPLFGLTDERRRRQAIVRSGGRRKHRAVVGGWTCHELRPSNKIQIQGSSKQGSGGGRQNRRCPILAALAHAHWRARGHAAGAGHRRPIPAPTGRLATPPAGPRLRERNVASPGTGPPLHVRHCQVESFTVQRGQVGYERVGGTGRVPTLCPMGDAASVTAVPKCVLTRVRSQAAWPGAARPHTRRGLVRRRAPASRPHRR